MKRILAFLIPIAFFASCGSDNDIQRPELYTLLLPTASSGRLGVLSSDLGSSGLFKTMSKDGLAMPGEVVVHSDATVRMIDGKVIILNGPDQNSVQVLDPNLGYLTSMEFSTGDNSNPRDAVLWDGNQLFVSLYNENTVGVFDFTTGSRIGSVDLSSIPSDGDGSVEPSALYLYNGILYLAVQRLNRKATDGTWPPAGTSYLVEIEPATRQVLRTFPFPAANPFGKFQLITYQGQPHLVISVPARLGYNFAIDGGIAIFSLKNEAFLDRFLYTEETAGGDILDMVIKNESEGYAVVEFQDFSVELQKFNPTTGERIGVLNSYPGNAGYVSGLLLTDEGILYSGEVSSTSSGILIFNTGEGDQRLNTEPIAVGYRPTGLVWIE